MICALYKPGIICVVESWLDSTIEDAEICIQGYKTVRLDRNRHGGGLVIYVNNLFTSSVLYSGSPDFEFLMLSLTSPRTTVINPDFYIALFYRPPSSNISLLDTLFSTLCNLNPSIFVNTCIIGDFNIDFLSPPQLLYNKLLSVMSSFNLSQVISEPTRVVNDCSSLIDFAFVSVPGTVQLCETIPPLGNSDHLGIHLIMSTKLKMNSQKSQLRNIWRYNLADFDQAMEL